MKKYFILQFTKQAKLTVRKELFQPFKLMHIFYKKLIYWNYYLIIWDKKRELMWKKCAPYRLSKNILDYLFLYNFLHNTICYKC